MLSNNIDASIFNWQTLLNGTPVIQATQFDFLRKAFKLSRYKWNNFTMIRYSTKYKELDWHCCETRMWCQCMSVSPPPQSAETRQPWRLMWNLTQNWWRCSHTHTVNTTTSMWGLFYEQLMVYREYIETWLTNKSVEHGSLSSQSLSSLRVTIDSIFITVVSVISSPHPLN